MKIINVDKVKNHFNIIDYGELEKNKYVKKRLY